MENHQDASDFALIRRSACSNCKIDAFGNGNCIRIYAASVDNIKEAIARIAKALA